MTAQGRTATVSKANRDGDALISVRDLTKRFPIRGRSLGRRKEYLQAVNGVSFELRRGETLALVGESGCGKTTTARLILRLLEPTAGRVIFDGRDTLDLRGNDLKRFRRRAQIVFQDPYGSLNPRMTVRSMLREVLHVHDIARGREADLRVAELLEAVGLRSEDALKYPHEFSGGQRQRIGIARALAVEPEFIVADEPMSALDVSVQAQVLNLLVDLQEQFRLTYLFITHDLSVVRHIADRVAVMYLGAIVETGPCGMLFDEPVHPYTQALLSAVLSPGDEGGRTRIVLSGEVPSAADPPTGCPFHPRCQHPEKDEICQSLRPPLETKAAGVLAACHKVPGKPLRGAHSLDKPSGGSLG